MKFHEEMEKAFLLSHSADALEHREEPEGHDYSGAEVYLTHIKEAIRGQLRTAPEAHAEGHVILGSLPLEEGPGTPEDFVLVDRENPEPGLLHGAIGAYLTRRGSLEQALRGIEAALAAGYDKIKLNAVLMGGVNDDEIPALAELTRRYPVDMRFIELMPMYDGGDFGPEAFIPCTAVLDRLPEAEKVERDGGVAKLYRLPGALGNIGLISPVSAHFCAACDRLRLTADGKLKPCLLDSREIPLEGLHGDELTAALRDAILAKPAAHGALSFTGQSPAGRPMNRIGG